MRVSDLQYLVVVNKICVYEVQVNDRISVGSLGSEKWAQRRNFHTWGRNSYNQGENLFTFSGESVHIVHGTEKHISYTHGTAKRALPHVSIQATVLLQQNICNFLLHKIAWHYFSGRHRAPS